MDVLQNMAADAFEFVKENGGSGSKSSNYFRLHISEIGGSFDFMDQYVKFRGSRPKMDGLLKASGISIK